MELTVGAILEGTVKTITNFGAFVALGENQTGMIHISEIADGFVKDINDFLSSSSMSIGIRWPMFLSSGNFLHLQGSSIPKAPLCKGSCQPSRLTEGLSSQKV